MSVHKCSLCNRPAAWLICEELFCEVDKEGIINRFGVDFFLMERLSENEKDFTIRGKHRQPLPRTPHRVSKKLHKTKAK
jgi:hypothetical protein